MRVRWAATRTEGSAQGDEQVELPRVLVVDDLPRNSKLVEAILEPLACEVVHAHSGQEALARLDTFEFAVLLLDVQMPEMDGYELARRARAHPRAREVPILFLTAMGPGRDVALRVYESGAVDLLFKPLDATILRSKVQIFLELHMSRQRLAAAYKELKTTQAQLIQAAKMASLGELVAGIAHEVNNPLAFVLSHLETVKKNLSKVEQTPGTIFAQSATPDWDRAMTRLDEMRGGLVRIRDLVSKLRVFSRIEEGERKAVSIRESVESVLLILGHRLTNVTVQLDCGLPDLLECYPSLLNQALLNIVANAIDAIGGGGAVSIRTEVSEGNYSISVRDSGPGIPFALKDRIFEPFFTTKAPGEGTGLGLSITYSIMRHHGGTLDFDCPSEGGTIMKLVFPYSSD